MIFFRLYSTRCPRPAPVDHLGLGEAVDRLRERIVKTVAHAADRGLDPGRSQALGVANRDVLGGFKWSSQHGLCELFGGTGPEPRPVFSSPGSFAACC